MSSKSCGPVLLLIRTITQFVADEIPEPTRRPHCVARRQGKSEKKIEIIFVLLRKPKSMMNRSKRKLNLTQSGILERAGAFQLGVTLHERRSAFCRCYCTNAYANDFCGSFDSFMCENCGWFSIASFTILVVSSTSLLREVRWGKVW